MTDDDQLRADRDRLVESLFALRGRLVVTGRDERLPEPVQHLIVCLLSGYGIERAIVALAATQRWTRHLEQGFTEVTAE